MIEFHTRWRVKIHFGSSHYSLWFDQSLIEETAAGICDFWSIIWSWDGRRGVRLHKCLNPVTPMTSVGFLHLSTCQILKQTICKSSKIKCSGWACGDGSVSWQGEIWFQLFLKICNAFSRVMLILQVMLFWVELRSWDWCPLVGLEVVILHWVRV